jgi:hypothetical protein
MLSMCGVFAEFERSINVERVNAGFARARAQGKTLGRPKLDAAIEARIRALRAASHGINKTAKLAGVGVSPEERLAWTAAHRIPYKNSLFRSLFHIAVSDITLPYFSKSLHLRRAHSRARIGACT